MQPYKEEKADFKTQQGDRALKSGYFMSQKKINTALILAIAFIHACKVLQRRTGVIATDWQKELLGVAIVKFEKLTPEQLEKYITDNFDLG